MNNTLKTLSQIITPEFQQLSLEQLAEAYTDGLNPSVLASAFSKTFKLILDISNMFRGFTEQDIASYSLETLDKCLQTYNTNQAAFSTYFTTVFRNRLRTESQMLSTHKRKVTMYSSSLEALMDNGFDMTYNQYDYNESNILEQFKEFNLTQKELRYCKLLLEGYNNKEISEILDTTVMTLCNMRKKLRIKLSSLCL